MTSRWCYDEVAPPKKKQQMCRSDAIYIYLYIYSSYLATLQCLLETVAFGCIWLY